MCVCVLYAPQGRKRKQKGKSSEKPNKSDRFKASFPLFQRRNLNANKKYLSQMWGRRRRQRAAEKKRKTEKEKKRDKYRARTGQGTETTRGKRVNFIGQMQRAGKNSNEKPKAEKK